MLQILLLEVSFRWMAEVRGDVDIEDMAWLQLWSFGVVIVTKKHQRLGFIPRRVIRDQNVLV